jgi:hypothetical protein
MSKFFEANPAAKAPARECLRKIEQTPTEYCQYSEYLTLLNSFPDVKKSDRGASHETKSRQLVGSAPSFP